MAISITTISIMTFSITMKNATISTIAECLCWVTYGHKKFYNIGHRCNDAISIHSTEDLKIVLNAFEMCSSVEGIFSSQRKLGQNANT
jgi:hypothetical protein